MKHASIIVGIAAGLLMFCRGEFISDVYHLIRRRRAQRRLHPTLQDMLTRIESAEGQR